MESKNQDLKPALTAVPKKSQAQYVEKSCSGRTIGSDLGRSPFTSTTTPTPHPPIHRLEATTNTINHIHHQNHHYHHRINNFTNNSTPNINITTIVNITYFMTMTTDPADNQVRPWKMLSPTTPPPPSTGPTDPAQTRNQDDQEGQFMEQPKICLYSQGHGQICSYRMVA